jgi:hypothetical protein
MNSNLYYDSQKKFSSIFSFIIEALPTKLLKKNSRVIVMYIPPDLGQYQGGLFGKKSKYLYKQWQK